MGWGCLFDVTLVARSRRGGRARLIRRNQRRTGMRNMALPREANMERLKQPMQDVDTARRWLAQFSWKELFTAALDNGYNEEEWLKNVNALRFSMEGRYEVCDGADDEPGQLGGA